MDSEWLIIARRKRLTHVTLLLCFVPTFPVFSYPTITLALSLSFCLSNFLYISLFVYYHSSIRTLLKYPLFYTMQRQIKSRKCEDKTLNWEVQTLASRLLICFYHVFGKLEGNHLSRNCKKKWHTMYMSALHVISIFTKVSKNKHVKMKVNESQDIYFRLHTNITHKWRKNL